MSTTRGSGKVPMVLKEMVALGIFVFKYGKIIVTLAGDVIGTFFLRITYVSPRLVIRNLMPGSLETNF